jgi:hypothetical protein
MDREDAKRIAPFIQAFGDGKTVQRQDFYGSWTTVHSGDFWESSCNYRIKPEKRKVDVWLNVYADSRKGFHPSRAEADAGRGHGRIACLHIIQEYEEGEGL